MGLLYSFFYFSNIAFLLVNANGIVHQYVLDMAFLLFLHVFVVLCMMCEVILLCFQPSVSIPTKDI